MGEEGGGRCARPTAATPFDPTRLPRPTRPSALPFFLSYRHRQGPGLGDATVDACSGGEGPVCGMRQTTMERPKRSAGGRRCPGSVTTYPTACLPGRTSPCHRRNLPPGCSAPDKKGSRGRRHSSGSEQGMQRVSATREHDSRRKPAPGTPAAPAAAVAGHAAAAAVGALAAAATTCAPAAGYAPASRRCRLRAQEGVGGVSVTVQAGRVQGGRHVHACLPAAGHSPCPRPVPGDLCCLAVGSRCGCLMVAHQWGRGLCRPQRRGADQ